MKRCAWVRRRPFWNGVGVGAERVSGIEPPSSAWKADILAVVLHPRYNILSPDYEFYQESLVKQEDAEECFDLTLTGGTEAEVAELVYATDLKSVGCKTLWVRVPPSALESLH